MSVLTLRKRIIYDTHGANIYINICTTKIFIEKVKMTISYQEEIKFISNKIRELRKEKQRLYKNSHTAATWKDPI